MNWKAVEALGSANPVTVSAPKSHVRPNRNVIAAILMSKLARCFLRICLVLCVLVFFPAMFDQHHDHHSKYNNVEEQDDKDWAQEGSKEDCRIGDEAAGRRDRTHEP